MATFIEAIYPSRDKPFGIPRLDGSGPMSLEDELQLFHSSMIDLDVIPADHPFDRDQLIFIRQMMIRENLEVKGKRGWLRKLVSNTFTRRPPPFRKNRKKRL